MMLTSDPYKAVLDALLALRDHHDGADQLARQILEGDIDAYMAGVHMVGVSIDLHDKIADRTGCASNPLFLEVVGVQLVADAVDIASGEIDPRDFRTDLPLDEATIARWVPTFLRCTIARSEAFLAGFLATEDGREFVTDLRADIADMRDELAQLDGAR